MNNLCRLPGPAYISLLTFTLLGLTCPRLILALEPADIYQRWGPAVVTVVGSSGSQGSGFVIPPLGYVATNYHVIDGQSQVSIISYKGESRPAAGVLYQDATRDLAVLSIDATGLPMVVLGDSSAVQPGERAIAIGSPRGLPQTVTDGIISQVRSCPTVTGVACLQMTTPISPGSSGSPLFNTKGEVIGITSMAHRGGQNLNFSIAVNELKRMLGDYTDPTTRADPSPPVQSANARSTTNPPARFRLYLWNGSTVSAEAYQETGDVIICKRGAGTLTLVRTDVSRISDETDGTVRQVTATPSRDRPVDSGERKVDIQEFINRPYPKASSPAGGAPLPLRTPAGQGACAAQGEFVANTDWRVIAGNLVRLNRGGRSDVLAIRGLGRSDLQDWQARQLVESVFRESEQLAVVDPRPDATGQLEATICSNGKDVAAHPRLAPLRKK